MKEEALKKSIKRYNKYRSPRATAELKEMNDEGFKVQFEGSFDESCCMDEYFFDLVYELKDEGVKSKLLDFEFKEGIYIADFAFA